jgi:hypothetical protein
MARAGWSGSSKSSTTVRKIICWRWMGLTRGSGRDSEDVEGLIASFAGSGECPIACLCALPKNLENSMVGTFGESDPLRSYHAYICEICGKSCLHFCIDL